MKCLFLCIWTALTFLSNSIAQIQKSPLIIGEQVKLISNQLNEERTLNIYLPNGYYENLDKNFPVVYLLDGGLDEDFLHISGIIQFGSFSWINMLPPSIVVGIVNVDRKRDFTYPSKLELDQKEFPTSGGSSKFISFIKTELQEYISVNYRVTNEKTIIGQSLGGLLATEILFSNPNLFSNYIIISPSLWWDSENLLKTIPKKIGDQKNVFIGVGKEGKVMERTANELYQKLKEQKSENSNLYFKFFEDKNHGDALHQSVYEAFEKIYPK